MALISIEVIPTVTLTHVLDGMAYRSPRRSLLNGGNEYKMFALVESFFLRPTSLNPFSPSSSTSTGRLHDEHRLPTAWCGYYVSSW